MVPKQCVDTEQGTVLQVCSTMLEIHTHRRQDTVSLAYITMPKIGTHNNNLCHKCVVQCKNVYRENNTPHYKCVVQSINVDTDNTLCYKCVGKSINVDTDNTLCYMYVVQSINVDTDNDTPHYKYFAVK